MKNHEVLKEDFKWLVQMFINRITNHYGEDRTSSEIPRKLFRLAFDHLEMEINDLVGGLKERIEKSFKEFDEEIAESLCEDFGKILWTPWEDGHDVSYQEWMLCYFKTRKEYEVGRCVPCDGESSGSTFLFKDGRKEEPDFICSIIPCNPDFCPKKAIWEDD